MIQAKEFTSVEDTVRLVAASRSLSNPVLVISGRRRSFGRARNKGIIYLPAGSDPRGYLGGLAISGVIIEMDITPSVSDMKYILTRFRSLEDSDVVMIMNHSSKEMVRKILREGRENFPKHLEDKSWALDAALAKPFPFTEFKINIAPFVPKEI